jgi:hypothetical protein
MSLSLPGWLPWTVSAVVALTAGPARAQAPDDASQVGPYGGAAQWIEFDPLDANRLLVPGPRVLTLDDQQCLPSNTGLPENPFIRDVLADPDDPGRLLALGSTKLYESSDSGASWSEVALGLPPGEFLILIRLNPAPGGDRWLGSAPQKTWLSEDDGLTWNLVADLQGLTTLVAWSPTDASKAYALADDELWVSVDGGSTFQLQSVLPDEATNLAVDPGDGERVFVGTEDGRLFLSENGGATFLETSVPTAPSPSLASQGKPAEFMRVQPDSGGRLWWAFRYEMWFSDDDGASWSSWNEGLGTHLSIEHLEFGSSGALYLGMLFDGVYRRSSADSEWSQVGTSSLDLEGVVVLPDSGRRIAFDSQDGLWVSEGPQQTFVPGHWNDLNGISQTQVSSFMVDPNDSDRWWIGSQNPDLFNGQLTLLTDSGTLLGSLELFSPGSGEILDLCSAPSQPTRFLAANLASESAFGLLMSDDSGETWNAVDGSGGVPVASVTVDPFDADHWFAVRWQPSFPGNPLGFLLETADAGQSVTELGPLPGSGPIKLRCDPLRPGILYYWTVIDGLYRSDDGGAGWSLLVGTGPGLPNFSGAHVEFHPSVPGVFWFGLPDGSLRLTGDGGDSFITVWQSPFGSPLGSMAYDAQLDGLLVANQGASLYEVQGINPFVTQASNSSANGGALWNVSPSGGLPQVGNAGFGMRLDGGAPGVPLWLHLGAAPGGTPFLGGTLATGFPTLLAFPGVSDGSGAFEVPTPVPADASLIGAQVFTQGFAVDAAAVGEIALSDGLAVRVLP